MATVRYIAARAYRAQVDTINVNDATAATVYTVTHTGTGDVATYTSVSGDTVDSVAAAIANAMSAVAGNTPFAELTPLAAGSGGNLIVTGPADGSPYTLTVATAPAARATISSTITPQSAKDLSDTANYSTGALPGAGDTLVFENGATGPAYNLTALSAIALASVVRRSTFTGQMGLADVSPGGYLEFRTKTITLNCTTATFEAAPQDVAQQFRLKFTTSTAVSINGSGAQPAALMSEVFYVEGLTGAATLSIVGSSVCISPSISTACTIATLTAFNSTVRITDSAAITTATFTNCANVDMGCGATTLTQDKSGVLRLYGTGAYTTLNAESGTVFYQSSGTITTLNIGSDGVFDLTLSANKYTLTTLNFRGDGGTIRDPTRKTNIGTVKNYVSTDPSSVTEDWGSNCQWTLTA